MRVILFILSLWAFWLGLSGHYTALFFGLGAFSVGFVVVMKLRLSKVVPLRETFLPKSELKPFSAVRYLLWLSWQIVLSNISVAKIILSPRMNIQPHFVDVPAKQRTLLGEVTFANSITLTPGTISIETIDRNHITVHALTRETGDRAALDDMSKRVCAIEPMGEKQ
jgi:multicomponent Na+:H+ antiporter subunit E